MDPILTGELLRQHVELLTQMERLWVGLLLVAFLGLVFIVVMFGLAAWSVNTVNKRQDALEGKFTLLIDILLEQAKRENIRRNAEDGA